MVQVCGKGHYRGHNNIAHLNCLLSLLIIAQAITVFRSASGAALVDENIQLLVVIHAESLLGQSAGSASALDVISKKAAEKQGVQFLKMASVSSTAELRCQW